MPGQRGQADLVELLIGERLLHRLQRAGAAQITLGGDAPRCRRSGGSVALSVVMDRGISRAGSGGGTTPRALVLFPVASWRLSCAIGCSRPSG
jgi:hypothetical protein